MISFSKQKNLDERMKRLGIFEQELNEKFVKSSGKGGQNVNKLNTCVHLRHEPTGLEVKCQRTRSQQDNRYFARRLLCDKLETQIQGKRSEEAQKRHKIRRQKRKRSKRAKEKILKEKKAQSEKKANRKPPL